MILMKNFLKVPQRSSKPRNQGLTMLIDSGRGTSQVSDVLEVGSELIDYVKLGWATSVVSPNLEKKIEIYHNSGIPVCLGGTLFELSFLQNKIPEYIAFAKNCGVKLLEVSDGTITMARKDKLHWIEQLSKDFTVLSEYGNKTDGGELEAPSYWAKRMKEELEAGSWKVIAEGRESGTAGMYRDNAELRTGLVDEILLSIDLQDVMWEAPLKAQQTWFINKYGADVNLGNISFHDIIPLETLRLGLRSDTLFKFNPES